MRIFQLGDELPAEVRGGVVAIGNFDGVHRGHQVLIGEAGRIAAERRVPLGVLTFEPHPRAVFRPEGPPFRLTPLPAKARLLERLGVESVFTQRFDRAFSEKAADQFIDEVLVEALGAFHVVIGQDFLFGHARAGHAETLSARGAALGASGTGFGVTAMPPVVDPSGEVYSSTRVRTHLSRGEPGKAAHVLGRYWEIEGAVVPGDRRGRVIGFPTANVALGDYLRPAYGIYAVRVTTPDGIHDGVANLGIRPMWQTEEPMLEAHLFGFSGDLYGKVIRVQLVEFIRAEAKFDGVEALVAQIGVDAENARNALVNSRIEA